MLKSFSVDSGLFCRTIHAMYEYKLHQIQKELVKKLSTAHSFRFNDLVIDGLASEHINYHLKRLQELQFVIKRHTAYSLTDLGKDYVNSLDDETGVIEKLPKVAVILHCVKQDPETGEILYLLNRRLEQPYFGKVGRIGGKVRFGETFEDAAKRELYEETGLTAKTLTLEKMYRKIRKRLDGQVIQDVIFYTFFTSNISGNLIHKTRFQENFWISARELELHSDDYDRYDDLVLEERLVPKELYFEESIGIADGF